MLTFKNYNIADWFSFYRIFAAPFLILIAWYGHRELFSWLLLLSYSTDMIDGFLARKLKITSPRGSQLDSMGDQLTLIAGFIGLLCVEFEFISEQYQWILIPFTCCIVSKCLLPLRNTIRQLHFIPIWQNYLPLFKLLLFYGCCFSDLSIGCSIP